MAISQGRARSAATAVGPQVVDSPDQHEERPGRTLATTDHEVTQA